MSSYTSTFKLNWFPYIIHRFIMTTNTHATASAAAGPSRAASDIASRAELFTKIREKLEAGVDAEFIKSTKTQKGDTQKSERTVIERIRSILTELSLTFQEAGSQQSKDFRNVGGIGLDIEIKKTDSATIYFNDTVPTENIFYVILFTGKENKRAPQKSIPAQLAFVNGLEFVKDSPWIEDYIQELTRLKDKYARGASKKELGGIMSVYPRPTFKADISGFLKGSTLATLEPQQHHNSEPLPRVSISSGINISVEYDSDATISADEADEE